MKYIERKKEPRFLLLYSPQSFHPRYGAAKPEGSLGLLYLASSLRDSGFEVQVLDCCVGGSRHTLRETFERTEELPNGKIRIGLSWETIMEEVNSYDVIGITSIFTAQTRMVEELVKRIKTSYPDKLVILGGVNARSQMPLFFAAGVDIICLSEAERTIVDIGNQLRGDGDFSSIPGIAFKSGDGRIITNSMVSVLQDLDNLPIPSWDLLNFKRYWDIARPHGGGFSVENPVKYASVITQRGCPFRCSYCHVSLEVAGSVTGNIRSPRQKSIKRVLIEMDLLKRLGVEHVFLEDDSLLFRRERAMDIFRSLKDLNLRLSDVNGVNLAHLNTVRSGMTVVDEELIEAMAAAGMTSLTYPVESGSQRIIDRWATGKLNLAKHNIIELIRIAKKLGMRVTANYLFGYPDETLAEMMETFMLARRHIDAGLDNANFHIVTPFPGTALYELAIKENLFIPGVHVADLDWISPSLRTVIEPWVLEFIIFEGWRYINRPERIERLRSMVPKVP